MATPSKTAASTTPALHRHDHPPPPSTTLNNDLADADELFEDGYESFSHTDAGNTSDSSLIDRFYEVQEDWNSGSESTIENVVEGAYNVGQRVFEGSSLAALEGDAALNRSGAETVANSNHENGSGALLKSPLESLKLSLRKCGRRLSDAYAQEAQHWRQKAFPSTNWLAQRLMQQNENLFKSKNHRHPSPARTRRYSDAPGAVRAELEPPAAGVSGNVRKESREQEVRGELQNQRRLQCDRVNIIQTDVERLSHGELNGRLSANSNVKLSVGLNAGSSAKSNAKSNEKSNEKSNDGANDEFIDESNEKSNVDRIASGRRGTRQRGDRFAFVMGANMLWMSAFVMGRFPLWIPQWYASITILLLLIRFVTYKRRQWHYFCFDFCYFTNFLTLLWLFVLPQSQFLYTATFCMAHGPLAWAILAWKNSLVFHSLDKTTSVFIHLAPAVTFYTLRWLCPDTAESQLAEQPLYYIHGRYPLRLELSMPFLSSWGGAVVFYLIWQFLYFVGIMQWKKHKIQGGERMTSYSWLLDPKKNAQNPSLMYLLCLPKNSAGVDSTDAVDSGCLNSFANNLSRQSGAAQNSFNERKHIARSSTATSTITPAASLNTGQFMFWQLIYTSIALLPTSLFWRYEWLHALFLVLIVSVSLWNGGSHYLQSIGNSYKVGNLVGRTTEQLQQLARDEHSPRRSSMAMHSTVDS